MIKLCAFSDEAAKSLPLQIKALQENGIPYMELRGIDGVNVSSFSESDAREYASLMKSEGISVFSVGSPLGKVDIGCDFDAYLEVCRRVFHIAGIFETDKVRVFSFYNAFDKGPLVLERLNKMLDVADEYGVHLYHENEKNIYGDVPMRVKEIQKNLPDMKFVYDPANFIQCGVLPSESINALVDSADYFHIKDALIKTGELVPCGYGDGEIDRIFSRLNRDTVLTLEPHLKVFDGYAAVDKREMRNKFEFSTNLEAFNFAACALKESLIRCGYEDTGSGFEKI